MSAMPDKGGAWLSPWLPLLDVDTLKRCMEFRPAPLTGLADLPIASATTRLDKAMKTVFFPTAQCVEFAWMVVQRVIENLVENYPSFETYKDAIYSGEPNLPMETIPMSVSYTHLDVYKRQEIILSSNPAGIALTFADERLYAV